MADPDYIVVRGTDSKFDGRWYDRATFRRAPIVESPVVASVTLRPTGEFEVREDGVVAEVWRPVGEGD